MCTKQFFPNSERSHWLLRGHTTSNNETVARQNLQAGYIAKSLTSESNSVLLSENVDQRRPRFSEFPAIWFPQISMFPSTPPQETLRFSGKKLTVSLGTSH